MMKQSTWGLIKDNYRAVFRLLKYSHGFRVSYGVALFFNALTMVRFSFIIGFSIQWVTDSALNGEWQVFRTALLFAAIAWAVNGVIYYFEGYLMLTRVERMMEKLRIELFDKVTKLPVVHFDDHHSGDILSRITGDLPAASHAVSFTLVDPINFIMLGIGNLFFIGLTSVKMAAICLVLALGIILFNTLFLKRMQKLNEQIRENTAASIERYCDIINSTLIVRVFNLKDWVFGRYDRENQKILKDQGRLVGTTSCQNAMNNLLNNVCTFIVIGIGAIFLERREFTVGALLAIFRYVSTLVFAFTGFGNVMSDVTQSVVAAKRVLEVLDYDEEVNQSGDDECSADLHNGEAVGIVDVSFSYAADQDILHNLSLSVKNGQTAALVGPSGAGKSTLLNLISGYYPLPCGQGEIRLYGQRADKYTLRQRRQLIAYVLQDNHMFAENIRENIRYGKQGASDEQIIDAARAAHAHEFITALPNGYETMLGEGGVALSGGEKQRIAIARAILKDAPLILLDEATASLDMASERKVRTALERLMKGKTAVIVAHRLATITNADCIFVIADGQVIEHGGHDELMQEDGMHRRYFNLLNGFPH